ncbi:unnamed protein product [Closterium sp. NIES-53]
MALAPWTGMGMMDPFAPMTGLTSPTGPLEMMPRWMRFPDEFSSLFEAPTASFLRETQDIARTAVDVRETNDAFKFIADMPGLRREEVKVQIEDGNVLAIRGERTREKKEDTGRYHRMERSSGKFLRRFRLPENTEVDKVTANTEHGVLTVTVPKKQPTEPQKEAEPNVRDVKIQSME